MTANINEWYIFDAGTIDKKICNKIKRWAKDKWEDSGVDTSKGITDEERKTGMKGDYKPDPTFRISDVAWTNEQWLYDIVWGFMKRANYEAGWRYDIKACESCQITRYKKGGFYSWHNDGKGCHKSSHTYGEDPNKNVRKLIVLRIKKYKEKEIKFLRLTSCFSKLRRLAQNKSCDIFDFQQP